MRYSLLWLGLVVLLSCSSKPTREESTLKAGESETSDREALAQEPSPEEIQLESRDVGEDSPTRLARSADSDADKTTEQADELKIQFFHGEGEPPSMFILINEEGQPITDFKLTTYPPPIKPGNILLSDKSYFTTVANIEKGGSIQVLAADLKNAKGERLSDSKVKVGVVHLMGKVGGVPKGAMMDLAAEEDEK
jgi:hypothetical protein